MKPKTVPKPILRAPKDGLGFGNTDAKAVTVEEFDWEAFEVVLPEVTFDILAEHFADHLDGLTRETFDKFDGGKTEAVLEAFHQSDARDEWKDAYNPMMLYFWPLFMHGKDPERVAALIDEFAPAVTLVEIHSSGSLADAIGEDYALCLNGGGMDLSDHLTLAYICAGAVPPTKLLSGLSGVISKDKADRCKGALVAAYNQAVGGLKTDIERLDRTRKEIFGKARKGVNRHKA